MAVAIVAPSVVVRVVFPSGEPSVAVDAPCAPLVPVAEPGLVAEAMPEDADEEEEEQEVELAGAVG